MRLSYTLSDQTTWHTLNNSSKFHQIVHSTSACKTLRLRDNSLFITGSNSKLLSQEYTTEFSGRYISLRVQPFIYREITEYAEELSHEVSTLDYLIWGGFPKRFEFDTPAAIEAYLNELNKSIIQNDLIVRYNIQNTKLFRRVANYVLKSNSRILSARSIESHLKNDQIDYSTSIVKHLRFEDFLLNDDL